MTVIAIREDVNPDIQARLKAFIRSHKPGGCKRISKGQLCTCPLCDVDDLCDEILKLASDNQELFAKGKAEGIAEERARLLEWLALAGKVRMAHYHDFDMGATEGYNSALREMRIWLADATAVSS